MPDAACQEKEGQGGFIQSRGMRGEDGGDMLPKGEIVIEGGKYVGQARASGVGEGFYGEKAYRFVHILQKRGKGVKNAGVVDAGQGFDKSAPGFVLPGGQALAQGRDDLRLVEQAQLCSTRSPDILPERVEERGNGKTAQTRQPGNGFRSRARVRILQRVDQNRHGSRVKNKAKRANRSLTRGHVADTNGQTERLHSSHALCHNRLQQGIGFFSRRSGKFYNGIPKGVSNHGGLGF